MEYDKVTTTKLTSGMLGNRKYNHPKGVTVCVCVYGVCVSVCLCVVVVVVVRQMWRLKEKYNSLLVKNYTILRIC